MKNSKQKTADKNHHAHILFIYFSQTTNIIYLLNLNNCCFIVVVIGYFWYQRRYEQFLFHRFYYLRVFGSQFFSREFHPHIYPILKIYGYTQRNTRLENIFFTFYIIIDVLFFHHISFMASRRTHSRMRNYSAFDSFRAWNHFCFVYEKIGKSLTHRHLRMKMFRKRILDFKKNIFFSLLLFYYSLF